MELRIKKKLKWFRNRILLIHEGITLLETKSLYSRINSLSNNNELFVRMERNWTQVNWSVFDNDEEYKFITISGTELHFQFKSNMRTYDFYGKTKSRFFVFEKGNQVGFFELENEGFFGQLSYKLVCDDNANVSLLFLMVLFMDYLFQSDDSGIVPF